jgi:hypothetical protein
LQVLCIQYTDISKNDLKTISQFSELRTFILKGSIEDNFLTDEDVKYLLSLKKLRRLEIRNVRMTQHNFDLLLKNLPLEKWEHGNLVDSEGELKEVGGTKDFRKK